VPSDRVRAAFGGIEVEARPFTARIEMPVDDETSAGRGEANLVGSQWRYEIDGRAAERDQPARRRDERSKPQATQTRQAAEHAGQH
jgi:hypothetical protein